MATCVNVVLIYQSTWTLLLTVFTSVSCEGGHWRKTLLTRQGLEGCGPVGANTEPLFISRDHSWKTDTKLVCWLCGKMVGPSIIPCFGQFDILCFTTTLRVPTGQPVLLLCW